MAKKITNKDHLKLLKELKKHAGKGSQSQKEWVKKYLGTKKLYYDIKASITKKIAKEWIKKQPTISLKEYIKL